MLSGNTPTLTVQLSSFTSAVCLGESKNKEVRRVGVRGVVL